MFSHLGATLGKAPGLSRPQLFFSVKFDLLKSPFPHSNNSSNSKNLVAWIPLLPSICANLSLGSIPAESCGPPLGAHAWWVAAPLAESPGVGPSLALLGDDRALGIARCSQSLRFPLRSLPEGGSGMLRKGWFSVCHCVAEKDFFFFPFSHKKGI